MGEQQAKLATSRDKILADRAATFLYRNGNDVDGIYNKRKIKEAKRLLKFTSKSLEAISDYLAFSSQSHFSRVFKTYEKCAPGEYRRRDNSKY